MFHFRIHYLFFPLIACILSACGPDKHAESIITEAEQLLNSKPDSALVVLEEIRDSKADWPHSQQMHYELVYAQAQNKAYVNFTTDSIVLSLVDYYGRHGNANEQMMANYIMGCAYRDLGSAPKALESYRNAAEKADTTDSECDFRQLMLIHSQMANVYGELYSAGYEELEYDNALRLAIKIQDHSSMDIFENLKCHVLQKYNKFQECIRLTDSLREAYIQRGNFYRANSVCVYGFKSYLALGKYDSAHVYLENYAKIFNTDVSVRNIRGGKDALPILRGDYYLCTNKPDSALLYYRTVDLHKLIPTVRSYLYCNISTSYKMLSQTDSAYKYLALHAELMDKCYDSSVAEACINAQQLYDYGIEQKIAKQKSAEASLVKTYLIWTLIAIIILVTLLLYIRYRNLLAQKEAADLRIAHNNAMDSLRSAEVQLNILTSQKDEVEKLLVEETIKSAQYNDELSSINKDIIAKSTEIHKLKSMISQYEKMIEPDKYTDANELLCQSEAVHQFRKSLTAKGSSIDSCHWTKLQNTIRHLFPNFESQINKDGKLSKNDLQVCMLVKARFSPSEIEYIMNMKHSYATNARKRLHNTIFGFPGSGEEFDKKILSIK